MVSDMSLDNIRGQDYPVSLLKAALKQERLASAYLFIGPEGIGKKLVAQWLAKTVNCLNPIDYDSCDQCVSCGKITNLNHPDVYWINPEGLGNAIKIDQIRQLKSNIALRPYEAKKKVFIIDQADGLTKEAQNAFLKVLEEPPGDSLIILVASKPKLIFSTIHSRCQKIRFSSLSTDELKKILLTDFGLDKFVSHYLAHSSCGRIGKALDLKSRNVLREKNSVIDQFLFSKNVYESKEFNKDKYKESLNILASWFRDLYFVKAGLPQEELINIDRKQDLSKTASRYSFLDLNSIIDYISDNILYLDQNVNPKLLISNLRMKLWKK